MRRKKWQKADLNEMEVDKVIGAIAGEGDVQKQEKQAGEETGGEKMPKTRVKGHLRRKKKGSKKKVRVKGHLRKK